MINNNYDIVIIGAGMAGLYSAFTIKEYNINKSYIILEKNAKKRIGGRAGNDIFYNTKIVIGAGIGRKDKDKLLVQLLRYFYFPIKTHNVIPNYSEKINVIDIIKIINELKNHYKKYNGPSISFKNFAIKILGKEKYNDFVVSSGYTDYENEDINETLYYYGMEDNKCCWNSFSVPWDDLIMKLHNYIGEKNIKFNNEVIELIPSNNNNYNYIIKTNKKYYFCNKIIVATDIETLQKLFKNPIYREIGGQPFLRLYAKLSNSSIDIMKEHVKGYTFLEGPLQKIIPMEPDKGVYMIAYNDNKNTIKLLNNLENNKRNRFYFERLLEDTLDIPKNLVKIIALKDYYWKIGTHFYKPLKEEYKSIDNLIEKAQNPLKNILVVGEVVSRNQGWVEGALESVKKVVKKNWLNS
jgi:hypothetical protein